MKRFIKFFLVIALLALIVVIQLLIVDRYLDLDAVQALLHDLYVYAGIYYYQAVMLFIAVVIASIVFCLPVITVLTLLSGYLFGVVWGTMYVLIGMAIGNSLIFLLVRYFLSSYLRRYFAHRLTVLNKDLEEHGHHYLLSLQLFPTTPGILLNILVGLTQISLWTFLWTSILGCLPQVIFYTFLGRELSYIKSIDELMTWPIFFMFLALSLFVLLPVIIRKFWLKS